MPTSPHTHTLATRGLAWPSYPRRAWRVLGGSHGGRRSCHPAPPGSSSTPPSGGAAGVCSPRCLSSETALCPPSFDCLFRPPDKIRGRRVGKTARDGGWSHHSRWLCPDVSPDGSPEGGVSQRGRRPTAGLNTSSSKQKCRLQVLSRGLPTDSS